MISYRRLLLDKVLKVEIGQEIPASSGKNRMFCWLTKYAFVAGYNLTRIQLCTGSYIRARIQILRLAFI